MSSALPFTRPSMIAQLRSQNTPFDIVIIGGGATGLGSALDAAARGYSVALLEQADFAKGTSSKSTKLVHGGVRYLAQGNIALVLDALKERGLMRQNAPHLVHDMQFIIPAYSWWEKPWYGVGLTTYDRLAGKYSFGRSRVMSAAETKKLIPNVESHRLSGGVLYHDGQFDDARLALNMAQTAAEHGAVLVNYCRIHGLIHDGNKVAGVRATDIETGETFEVKARAVINATGPFTDDIRVMDEPAAKRIVSASQGIHIVLDRSFLQGDTAIMVPKTADGRVLFAIPWHDVVVVGTTDTPIPNASLEPRPLEQELDFVLSHARLYMDKDPKPSDVLSVFVGIRPLVGKDGSTSTASLSRDHSLMVSDKGLITITGGKWTTYRKMAQDTIDRAATVGGLAASPCTTRDLHIHGYVASNGHAVSPRGCYGSDLAGLEQFEAETPGHSDRIHPDLPITRGQVAWAARHEMARTVEDALSRRTRALLFNAKASTQAASTAAEIMAKELGHDNTWQSRQVEEYAGLAKQYQL